MSTPLVPHPPPPPHHHHHHYQAKNAHIPYRNSKLTYLLENCFSQDGKTMMLVNVSPTQLSQQETTCSLRFASQVNQCELGRAAAQVQDLAAVEASSSSSNSNSSSSGGGGGGGDDEASSSSEVSSSSSTEKASPPKKKIGAISGTAARGASSVTKRTRK
jgi:kinesin family protein C1